MLSSFVELVYVASVLQCISEETIKRILNTSYAGCLRNEPNRDMKGMFENDDEES